MYLAVQLVVGLSEMARKAKDKRVFFFFFRSLKLLSIFLACLMCV